MHNNDAIKLGYFAVPGEGELEEGVHEQAIAEDELVEVPDVLDLGNPLLVYKNNQDIEQGLYFLYIGLLERAFS